MTPARLILDPPASGAWNMAADEALLESARAGVASLRLYEWNEPTLSLGYFQAAADRRLHTASSDCPLVRRASGGGAIVHDRELTYCLAWPVQDRFGACGSRLYDSLHAALIDALAQFGVAAQLQTEVPQSARTNQTFLCFQRRAPGDVLVGDAKIAGSAQRRQRGGLLQHGSILLARAAAAPELPGVAELVGIHISASDFASPLADCIAARLSLDFRADGLTPAERERAQSLVAERFAASQWTARR